MNTTLKISLLFVMATVIASICYSAFSVFTPNNAEASIFFAPEICNNGIDDDLDGLIDCADSVMSVSFPYFGSEHDELLDHRWTVTQGKSGGGAGYNTDSAAGRRERLWMSPECLPIEVQGDLFGERGPR